MMSGEKLWAGVGNDKELEALRKIAEIARTMPLQNVTVEEKNSIALIYDIAIKALPIK